MDTGDKVSNIISAGPTGEPTDMFLTYVFDLQNPKGDLESNNKVFILIGFPSSSCRRILSCSVHAPACLGNKYYVGCVDMGMG